MNTIAKEKQNFSSGGNCGQPMISILGVDLSPKELDCEACLVFTQHDVAFFTQFFLFNSYIIPL